MACKDDLKQGQESWPGLDLEASMPGNSCHNVRSGAAVFTTESVVFADPRGSLRRVRSL